MEKCFSEKISDAKVLDLSMEIFKKKFKTLIGYNILFTIVLVIMIIGFAVILGPMLAHVPLGGMFSLVTFLFLMFIALGTLIGISKAGIFHIAHSYIEGQDMTASDAIGKAFSSFKPTLKVVTLLTVCLLPLMFALALMGIEISTITLFQSRMDASPILTFLVKVLLYSFIAALMGSYLFYTLHIAIFEEKTTLQAFNKSIKLAQGEVFKNIFRVFSIFIIAWGINLSVYAAITAGSGLLYFVLGKMESGYSLIAQIMLYVDTLEPYVDFLLGIILEPIGSIIWTLYYANIRYKKEGYKLHKMLHNLQQQETIEPTENIGLNNE
ncbi:MAG: glycerophosphoryl diester phosphodiesterase membrane domain-containing protein [Clostridiaceae bacterium]|nr:glycerophosphoryl diester phosphodiesterase membrane domain-containing protein [Clostridiaceae bacterium]